MDEYKAAWKNKELSPEITDEHIGGKRRKGRKRKAREGIIILMLLHADVLAETLKYLSRKELASIQTASKICDTLIKLSVNPLHIINIIEFSTPYLSNQSDVDPSSHFKFARRILGLASKIKRTGLCRELVPLPDFFVVSALNLCRWRDSKIYNTATSFRGSEPGLQGIWHGRKIMSTSTLIFLNHSMIFCSGQRCQHTFASGTLELHRWMAMISTIWMA
uniref:F-box domain-containing protein n=1 Tax=Ditylenchus dipsaci TaxID=166011 RepID=A0A915EFF6_9BILA